MNKKLQLIILALGLSVVLFAVGCSSDDDEDPPTGPTMAERLVGNWYSNQTTTVGDSVKLNFSSSGDFDMTEYFNFSSPDELIETKYEGTYEADDNSIQFHVTTRDDTVAVELHWDWSHTLSGADDDTLHMTHDYGTGAPVEIMYVNVTPPAN